MVAHHQHAMYATDLAQSTLGTHHDRLASWMEVTKEDLARFNERLVSRMQMRSLCTARLPRKTVKQWVRESRGGGKPKPAFRCHNLNSN
jgi:hypothetical protein